MTIPTTTPPKWYALSHHKRYKRLKQIQHIRCRRRSREVEDVADRTIYLDGRWINDVSSFLLSMGEAVNGPNGYFGGCDRGLDDCLIRGFGVRAPLTVRLSHYDEVREALDRRASGRFHAECFLDPILSDDDEDNPFDRKRLADPEYVVQYLKSADSLRELLFMNDYLGDGSDEDMVYWTKKHVAALADQPFDCDEFRPFFDAILRIFERRGAQLIPK